MRSQAWTDGKRQTQELAAKESKPPMVYPLCAFGHAQAQSLVCSVAAGCAKGQYKDNNAKFVGQLRLHHQGIRKVRPFQPKTRKYFSKGE